MVRKLVLFAAALLATAAASPAYAVEAGLSPYPKGLAGFMAGFVPPQEGFYVTDIYYYYNGSAAADVRNGLVELNVGVSMNVDLLEGMYITDWHPFGGTYAFGGALGYAWAGLDASVVGPLGGTTNISVNNDGLADSLILPALIGWHSGNFHWSTALFIYAPTGAYDPGQLNIGKNIWGFMPQFAITWFDPKSGWEVSSALTYVTMTTNDVTDYESGDILHMDWAIGWHFAEGWEVGAQGNIMEQIGADRGLGARLGPNKAESIGVGLGASYTTQIGHSPLVLGVKWEHDIDAHHTFEGDVLSANLTLGL